MFALRQSPRLVAALATAVALLLFIAAAGWAATIVERRSASAVHAALVDAGYPWANVQTDGLQVMVTGRAPSEAARFRALSAAGSVVDPARVIDAMEVADSGNLTAPDFTVEVLRNADGISLIGLVPAATDRAAIVAALTRTAGGGVVTDMLNTADHPAPPGWQPALDFTLKALDMLPRSKVSVAADRIDITAISDSAQEKARIEYDLRRTAPQGVALNLAISAPRPVITPFTVRFLIDADGARFDACAADTEQARTTIIAAATAAGATGTLSCTIGLGVPSPDWADAVTRAIKAVSDLGAGSVTFSDADVALVAAPGTDPATYDRVVGELESNLPAVFSLKAVLAQATDAAQPDALPEFTASLARDGTIQLRGRITDDRMREAVESFARARFGNDSVYGAMRIDAGLPDGWSLRVLAGLQALGELGRGSATVREATIRIEGVSGAQDTSATVARLLTAALGSDADLVIAISYDAALDPLAGLPTPEECAADLNAIVTANKITFEPGSATFAEGARATLDKLAERMKDCADFAIEIGGHTDAQGREEMNLRLSQDRADAVVAALMERRVLTGNLTAKGYGETVPVAANDSETGREANRRIEFRLVQVDAVAAATPDGAAVPVTVQTPGEDTLKPRPRPARE
jgi:OOP family OmpA-OmpF porin